MRNENRECIFLITKEGEGIIPSQNISDELLLSFILGAISFILGGVYHLLTAYPADCISQQPILAKHQPHLSRKYLLLQMHSL